MPEHLPTMKDSIIQFVKQTLGCQCPDEVFRHIECEQDIHLDSNIVLTARINVGNRLLIYIIETDNTAFIKDNLNSMVKAGKNERDKRGFNRFRLVLAGDDTDSLHPDIDKLFGELKVDDDKIHLHLIKNKEILFI
jgi:hypothetical protein